MSKLRDAASILVLKNDSASLSVLMGQRHAGHKFMPNRLVFPGGGVDEADFAAEAASPLRAEVQAQLEQDSSSELAAALGYAVARELEEETGLGFGRPPALDGLYYLCRAETPEESPIRFNARFFIADAAVLTGELAGSGELVSLGWYTLETILRLDIPIATRAVLEQLQIWLALSTAERLNWNPPVFRARGWVIKD